MPWITPITDRTQNDVDYALANQNSTEDLKGAWNISDVNRVIDDTIYLRDLLIEYGYLKTTFPNQPHFTESNLPYIDDVEILKDNIKTVVDAFYKNNNPAIIYGDVMNYVDANNMEINLLTTYTFLERVIAEFKRCGNFVTGQQINL